VTPTSTATLQSERFVEIQNSFVEVHETKPVVAGVNPAVIAAVNVDTDDINTMTNDKTAKIIQNR
jgi:hypothetical protein